MTQIGHICSVKFELIASIQSKINWFEWLNTKVVYFQCKVKNIGTHKYGFIYTYKKEVIRNPFAFVFLEQ